MPDQTGIVWYKANMGAPVLPVPSRVQSLDWSSHPWQAAGVGEVYAADRKFTLQPAKPVPISGRFCGTPDNFRGIAPKPSPSHARPLDELGLPLCCGAPAVLQMGMLLSLNLLVSTATVVPPVNTCIGSPILDLGVDYVWEVNGSVGEVFFARLFSLIPGDTYHIVITEAVFSLFEMNAVNTVGCGPPFGIIIYPNGVGRYTLPTAVYPDVLFGLEALIGPGTLRRVRFRLGAGP